MRILLICGSYPPMKCGVGDYTAHLAEALGKRKDAEVAVLTGLFASLGEKRGHAELFPLVERWTIREIRTIFRRIREWNPDVVHMQFGSEGYRRKVLPWLLPALLRFGHLPVVQTWHEYADGPLRILRNMPNSVISGGLVVVKPKYKKMMPRWYRWLIRHKHFRYIPNASAIPRVHLSDDEASGVRAECGAQGRCLVAFFGFANPRKGVEQIFDIADPARSCLVLICDLNVADPYHKGVLDRINSEPWVGRVTVTGYLPPEKVGRILAAADAVVLPFPDGGGVWSTSALAAMAQGTLVVATSRERQGYDALENVYYAHPGDVVDMREAMLAYMGRKHVDGSGSRYVNWELIADAHMGLYWSVLGQAGKERNSD